MTKKRAQPRRLSELTNAIKMVRSFEEDRARKQREALAQMAKQNSVPIKQLIIQQCTSEFNTLAGKTEQYLCSLRREQIRQVMDTMDLEDLNVLLVAAEMI